MADLNKKTEESVVANDSFKCAKEMKELLTIRVFRQCAKFDWTMRLPVRGVIKIIIFEKESAVSQSGQTDACKSRMIWYYTVTSTVRVCIDVWEDNTTRT